MNSRIKIRPAFVRTRTFIPFGIYRIVIAVAFALVIYAHGVRSPTDVRFGSRVDGALARTF